MALHHWKLVKIKQLDKITHEKIINKMPRIEIISWIVVGIMLLIQLTRFTTSGYIQAELGFWNSILMFPFLVITGIKAWTKINVEINQARKNHEKIAIRRLILNKKLASLHGIIFLSIFLIIVMMLPHVMVYSVGVEQWDFQTDLYSVTTSPSSGIKIPGKVFDWGIFIGGYEEIELRIIKDLKYNNYSTLDVYYPAYLDETSKKQPMIILIHGGSWKTGSKDWLDIVFMSRFLASSGFVVFAINYRLLPDANFTQIVNDVRDAIVFSKKVANQYHADNTSVFLWGRSAGAHLSLIAAYTADHPWFREHCGNYTVEQLRVNGVISFYAPTKLIYPRDPRLSRYQDLFKKFLGGTDEEVPEMYELASPVTHANRSEVPPTFIAHGQLDLLVDVEAAYLLADALKENNKPGAMVIVPWANHAYEIIPHLPGGQVSLYYALRFIALILQTS